MPSIPKYNQRSTDDLNYAKRRVVNLEKQGIAKLRGQSSLVGEDADKIAELLIKSIEDLVVLIQRLFGFLEEFEEWFLGGRFTMTDWNILNVNDRPRVIGLAITSNLQLKRIVRLANIFQKVFNFTSPSNIQKLKELVSEFDAIVEPYKEIMLSVLKKPPSFNPNDVRSVVSDLSDELFFDDSDVASSVGDYDPFDVDNFLGDAARDFIDHGIDLLRDYIGPQDDDDSDFQTARSRRSSRSSRSSSSRSSASSQFLTQGATDEKQLKKIQREIEKNIDNFFEIFNFIFNNYNEARTQLQQQLETRKEEIKEEYTGGSKRVYSVGNKYAEQMYNQSGMYK